MHLTKKSCQITYKSVTVDDEDEISSDTTVPVETMAKLLEERQRELNSYTNGNQTTSAFNGSLHTSRSMPFLDSHHCVDHGTQTYPSYIGERDRSRNTCIHCQGVSSANLSVQNSSIVFFFPMLKEITTLFLPRYSHRP